MATSTIHSLASAPAADSIGMLRWVFLRGRQTLTCEVRMHGRHAHDVCVVPHWDVKAAVVERFARPTSALQRHAEIAHEFRQAGWTVVHELAN